MASPTPIYEPYLDDHELWPLMPHSDRWIFNKLEVSIVLGHKTGPLGDRVTETGHYCVRPMMNFAGRGYGGVKRFVAQNSPRGITQPNYRPGRFWCEWFQGHHSWTEFIDDVAVRQSGGDETPQGLLVSSEETPSIVMPDDFKGISRYMLLEHIGGNIIEVSPRHMSAMATQVTLDDYRQFDPAYPDFPLSNSSDIQKVAHPLGFVWEPVDDS